jgi:HEAT repeat protein
MEAVVTALGKSRADEACPVLLRVLKKRGFFGRSRWLGIRLSALRALEEMATPAAIGALKSGRRLRPKVVRSEIKAALKRLSASSEEGQSP